MGVPTRISWTFTSLFFSLQILSTSYYVKLCHLHRTIHIDPHHTLVTSPSNNFLPVCEFLEPYSYQNMVVNFEFTDTQSAELCYLLYAFTGNIALALLTCAGICDVLFGWWGAKLLVIGLFLSTVTVSDSSYIIPFSFHFRNLCEILGYKKLNSWYFGIMQNLKHSVAEKISLTLTSLIWIVFLEQKLTTLFK